MDEHDEIIRLAKLCITKLRKKQQIDIVLMPVQQATDSILKEYSTLLRSYISVVNNHNLDKRDLPKVWKDLNRVSKAFMRPEHLLHIKITEQVRLMKLDSML